jgi:hypothetical protein
VALKTMEGFASFMLGNLRELFGGNWPGRLAYFLVRRRMGTMRERLDPHETGGAPLLGVNGVAIIAHGSSNARAIRNAVRAAGDEALVNHVNVEIVEILGRTQPAVAAKPPGKGIRALFSRMRERLQRHPKDAEASKQSEAADAAGSNHTVLRGPERDWVVGDSHQAGPEKPVSASSGMTSNGSKPPEPEQASPGEPHDEVSKPGKREPS